MQSGRCWYPASSASRSAGQEFDLGDRIIPTGKELHKPPHTPQSSFAYLFLGNVELCYRLAVTGDRDLLARFYGAYEIA